MVLDQLGRAGERAYATVFRRGSNWPTWYRARAPLEPRVSRWSEASADIRALRKLAKDGPFDRCIADARPLLAASLAVCAIVKSDDQGSYAPGEVERNNRSP